MRFMIIVKATKDSETGVMSELLKTERWQKLFAEMADYHEELQKAGVLLDGNGLHPSSKGWRVKYSGGKRTVIDGPFTETKELIAGYTLIKVKSKEEAMEWVRRFPNPDLDDGEIEVRQLFELEDFGSGFRSSAFARWGAWGTERSTRGRRKTPSPIPDGETTMRFMMLMIPKGYETAAPGTMPDAEAVAAMMKYNESLQKAGVLLALDGLHPPSMGARVSFAGGKPKVTDGPFAEAKEVLGGYWMIQVKSKEEAIEWASRCPAGDNEMIEVRQVQEMSDFPADVQEAAAGFAEMQKQAAGCSARSLSGSFDGTRRSGLQLGATEDGLIGSRDGYRHPSRDRRGLEDRVGEAHRRSRADGARRRPCRGARAGRARRRARAVAGVGHPGQPGRLAHGHREASRDRPAAPEQAARAQARGARPRARGRAGDGPRRISTPPSTTTSATTSCASCSRPAIRCSPPRRASRSRCACSAV